MVATRPRRIRDRARQGWYARWRLYVSPAISAFHLPPQVPNRKSIRPSGELVAPGPAA